MTSDQPELSSFEPHKTAIAHAEDGERALRRRYPDTDIQVRHSPNGASFYRFEVAIYGIEVPLVFGTKDVAELSRKGGAMWGPAFVREIERLKTRVG